MLNRTRKFSISIAIALLLMGCCPHLVQTESGLSYEILRQGKGQRAKANDEILLYETTRYRDGTILYSNENSGQPIKILIGGNQATQAVDEGLRGMRTGEIRRITAPPYLVRRKSYPPNVSPDSTLVITLVLHQILEKK